MLTHSDGTLRILKYDHVYSAENEWKKKWNLTILCGTWKMTRSIKKFACLIHWYWVYRWRAFYVKLLTNWGIFSLSLLLVYHEECRNSFQDSIIEPVESNSNKIQQYYIISGFRILSTCMMYNKTCYPYQFISPGVSG